MSDSLDEKDWKDSPDEEERSLGTSHTGMKSSGDQLEEELAKRETVAVSRLRLFVHFAIFVAAIVISFSVYLITSKGEQTTFRSNFQGSADQLLNAFESIVVQKVSATKAFATSITSYAKATNSKFPYVTIDDYQQRAESIISVSGSLFMGWFPIVTDDNVREWGNYSVANSGWLEESREYHRARGFEPNDALAANSRGRRHRSMVADIELDFSIQGMASEVFTYDETFTPIVDPGPGPYTPVWDVFPSLAGAFVNHNVLKYPLFGDGIAACLDTKEIVFGGFDLSPPGDLFSVNPATFFFSSILSTEKKTLTKYEGDPFSTVYFPVFDSFDEQSRKHVGLVVIVLQWAKFFENLLTTNATVSIVFENTCDEQNVLTYAVNGPDVRYIGVGDHHDPNYSSWEVFSSFQELLQKSGDDGGANVQINQEYCSYSIKIYPTKDFENHSTTNQPLIVTCIVAAIFILTSASFMVYNRLVERRQSIVLDSAQKTGAIVSSLFPKNVQARLLESQPSNVTMKSKGFASEKNRLISFLTGDEDDDVSNELDIKPIADLFPHSTVLFADITNFTSWSSTREPGHVFILLQTVYQAFDVIAKRYKVFKVETIGDSYVACTGVPNPQKNHAILMARFAFECRVKFTSLMRKLESVLGPDTADLGMRFGINSGPVTAGVLRGERARFQLFGDTMNTAARMEQTGVKNMIQVSQSTARLLEVGGKSHWLIRRDDSVQAKGKGVLDTWWIVPQPGRAASIDSSSGAENRNEEASQLKSQDGVKHSRLVNWLCNLILNHLRPVIARRQALGMEDCEASVLTYKKSDGLTSLDEVQECIRLPKFDKKLQRFVEQDSNQIEIDAMVVHQLREFVKELASMYRDNPFHNFEHAAHVTMAVDKFLKRIVSPDIETDNNKFAADLHDYTHGINSDPTTILAIIVSALIHDLDHRGVSNGQLIKESEEMAQVYKNKSVAEQNSLDLSWDLLMERRFDALRVCMFGNKADMLRFRQVLVNVVLATDIFDPELNALRKGRWEKAFSNDNNSEDYNDLRATIVIEHIIQASDVSHTMQHWHIYRKWNARLFNELFKAYKDGRMEKDPSVFWYQGELGFFDNYIIPLAKKLADCKVFGVSSDECLNYARRNRAEWEQRGKDLVAEMMVEVEPDSGPKKMGALTA